MQCCSCSVSTCAVCATCNVISPVKYILYFYISTSRSVCAVAEMAVFCGSLILCFASMLLGYCLSDFEIVPVAPIITGLLLLLFLVTVLFSLVILLNQRLLLLLLLLLFVAIAQSV